ncbi:GDSL-type esterase/lipase family protein [Phycicoccus sonneratiae]|uniref:G-D-S-L family lipolytic protein n=1 Tax=Phycicoccus sonneratiae TaxID=2807628 RepID=A0ABS2CLB5_9MICO|nr:GDSL-type esterase/lipase family protein [Phycicoccus sonneraticus]MBM6400677.1 G-D-S-L family lipolytic protein [Phycicoccus sonneraticus]
MADEHGGDDAGTPIEFRPSAEAAVVPDGPRDLALVFLGASLVAGVGDPKGQGWVTRVVGRTQHPELTVNAYNLGVRGDTSAQLLERWASEVPRRWAGRSERRLVLSVGTSDILRGVTLARHRLNLANLLDDATSHGVSTFVVSPPPSDDDELNARLEVLVDAQADVCSRRGVPFVDCYAPLLGHDQWRTDLAASRVPHHPGQAGYGLIAWLVLHNGWNEWLQIG